MHLVKVYVKFVILITNFSPEASISLVVTDLTPSLLKTRDFPNPTIPHSKPMLPPESFLINTSYFYIN